ncbi:MAG: RDD family protein [Ilumatobacteraceae bacterium]
MSDFPPPPPTSTDRLASIGQRALAQLIDSVIIGIPLFFVSTAISGDLTDADSGQLLLVTVLWLGVSLFYNTAMIAIYGATIGKRVMKLMVVNRVDGSAVTWTYAAVRALIPTVAGLVPVIGLAANLVVYLRAVFHPIRQGLHDAAAGTIVVRR